MTGPQARYVGEFDADDNARLWRVDGSQRHPVRHVAVASPVGLSWGYIGAGPADTARSLLADASGSEHVAEVYYPAFVEDVVDRLPRNTRFELPVDEVRGWLRGHGIEPVTPAPNEGRPLPTSEIEVVEWAQELEQRENDLARRELRLAERERVLDQAQLRLANEQHAWGRMQPVEPVWALPAGPVADEIRLVMHDTGDTVAEVAKGLGVDDGWALGVLDGTVESVDLPHVQALCDALHCTPYDFWGVDAGRAILHAYGPELWPRFIEPLDAWPPRPLTGPELGGKIPPPEPPGPDLGL